MADVVDLTHLLDTIQDFPPVRRVLLATAGTMALIFVTVGLLAHYGSDRLIPDITPGALPGYHISESRTEIIDPYVWILILSALAATVLGLAAVITRRPGVGGPPVSDPAPQHAER